jgi:beta-phosphoglucomutase-like phosphatase (HAD superfamily)
MQPAKQRLTFEENSQRESGATRTPAISMTLSLKDFDGAVFDFDDLLVGTQKLSGQPGFHLPLYAAALEQIVGRPLELGFKHALAQRIDGVTSHELLPLIHRTLLEFGINDFKSLTPEALGSLIEPYRREEILRVARCGDCPILPGARRIARELAWAGKKLGIYTSNRRSINGPMMEILFDAELKRLFPPDFILFGDEVVALGGKRKPDPFGFLTLAQRLDIPPERLIAIDDACEGLQGALDAGYSRAIGVDGGKKTDFSRIENAAPSRIAVVSELVGIELV